MISAAGGTGGYVYPNSAEFRRRGAQDAVREVRRFGSYAVPEVSRRMLAYLRSRTPIGGRLSKPTKAHEPGLAIRSWQLFAVPQGELRAFGIGNKGAWYVGVLNQGRRRNKTAYRVLVPARNGRAAYDYTVPARLRMQGSRQAPKGIIAPAWRRLKQDEQAVTQVALERYGAGA